MPQRMKVAGIDFSSHAVDVVTVPYEGAGAPAWTRFPLVGADAFDRARSVAQAVPGPSSVFWDDMLAVGIEHPAGKFGVGPLLRIQGAVLARIPARMLVQPWPPSKWRTANGIKGNASKFDVYERSQLARAEARDWIPGTCYVPQNWNAQDAHDAHLIALATRGAITKQEAA
jgi:hypothetical protein